MMESFEHNSLRPMIEQPLSGESFHYATTNVEDEACLDVSVQGFWHLRASFDVRVFKLTAPNYRNTAAGLSVTNSKCMNSVSWDGLLSSHWCSLLMGGAAQR